MKNKVPLIAILSLHYLLAWGQEVPTQVAKSGNSVDRILYPIGAAIKGANRDTGAIKITLPIDDSGGSFRMRIEVYNRGKSSTIWVNGLPYPENRWLSTEAKILTRQENQMHNVHFGYENGSATIWVGDQETTWHQFYLEVSEIIYTKGDLNNWDDGWQIAIDQSDFSNLVTGTVSTVLPIARSLVGTTNKHADGLAHNILFFCR